MEYKYIEIDNDVIVDENFLIQRLGLSKSFINKHSREMGVFRRSPRYFFLRNVIAYMRQIAEENQRKVMQKNIAKNVRKYEVTKMFEEIKKNKKRK